ncbi:MAG: PAS domain-containing protein [Rhizobiaceae bacterium]
MQNAGTHELFQYWNRLRGTRRAPTRTEIEPADIRTLLADTFILEIDLRETPVFRLAGTRLCAVFGRELKGFAFLSTWSADDQVKMARLVRNVVANGMVAIIESRGRTVGGRSNPFETILLPLDASQDSHRLLGATFALDKPYWLGADPLDALDIEALRVLDPDKDPLFLTNRPTLDVPRLFPRQADLSAPAPGTHPARKVRHLVVLEGGLSDRDKNTVR